MAHKISSSLKKVTNWILGSAIIFTLGIMLLVTPLLNGSSILVRLLVFTAISFVYGLGIFAIVGGFRRLGVETKRKSTDESQIPHTPVAAQLPPVIVNQSTIFIVAEHNGPLPLLHSAELLRQQGYDIRFIKPENVSGYSPYKINTPMNLIVNDAVKLPTLWISPN